MQVLVALLIGGFVLGGTRVGQWLRGRPLFLLAVCTIAASSFYLLRVVQ